MSYYSYILPEILIAVFALFATVYGVFRQGCEKTVKTIFGLNAILFIALIYVLFLIDKKSKAPITFIFDDSFIYSHLVFVMKAIVCIAVAGVSIIGLSNRNFAGEGSRKTFEFPILLALSTIGIFIMISAVDLMSVYLGLELSSLAMYVLVAMNRDNETATEAGVKYFVLGALASGILLYGSSLIYGFSGSTNLADIVYILSKVQHINEVSPAMILGLVLLFSGLFFKLSLAPMHFWAPDVYQGSSKVVLAFISTAPKVGVVAVLIRLISHFNGEIEKQFELIISVVAVLSMLVGCFAGVVQENIKRLIAYSGIANMGYLMIAVLLSDKHAVNAAVVYLAIYIFSSIGLMAIISVLVKNNSEDMEKISDFAGLSKINPLYAAGLAILLFSTAGIPPMAGFWGKFMIFKQAINAKLYVLSVIGVVSSVVAAYYYLKVIKVMYFDDVKPGVTKFISDDVLVINKALIIAAVIFSLTLFLYFGSFAAVLR